VFLYSWKTGEVVKKFRLDLMVLWALSLACCSAAARTLVASPTGNDAAAGTYAAPFATPQRAVDLAQPGDVVVLRAGVYNMFQSLRVVSKSGTAALPIRISGEKGAVLRSVGEGVPGVWRGIVEIDDSSSIYVSGVSVENSSFFGFRIQNSKDIKVLSSRSTVSLGSGVYALNVQSLQINGNDISRFCDRNAFGGGAGCQEGISLSRVSGFYVTNNQVHDAPQSVGVTSGGGEGIDVKDGCSTGVVAFNKVWNLVQTGIYIDGWTSGVANVSVYGNRVWNTSNGIAVASETGGAVSDVTIRDNVVYDVGYDGIDITNYKGDANGDGQRSRVYIYNNTVYNAGIKEAKPPYCLLWSNGGPCIDFGYGINIQSSNVKSVVIQDNIVYGSKTAPIAVAPAARSNVVVRTNLVYPINQFSWSGEYSGLKPIVGDPKFMLPSDDFHLNAGSAAIGTGTGGFWPGVDADNMLRSSENRDLGAYQYK
jgi:hypothetical protein